MTPPRLASWLLARRLHPGDRDEVLGDLAEDFGERIATAGPAAARRWYWRHALRLAWSLGPGADVYDSPRSRLMMVEELHYAARRLARQPWITAASVLTLACAIGAAVATWSLASAALLHPLEVNDPSRLMVVSGRYRTSPTAPAGPLSLALTYPAFDAIRSSEVFAEVAGSGRWTEPVEIAGVPVQRRTMFVSANFFHVLGRPLQVGREFSPADDRRGAPLVAILSDAVWRSALGANPKIGELPITIHGTAATIIGVAPADFRGVDLAYTPDLYMPLNVIGDITPPQLNWFNEPAPARMSAGAWMRVTARLRPSTPTAAAIAQLAALRGTGRAGSTLDVIDKTLGIVNIEAAALTEGARTDLTRFVRLLGTTVALLLTIGCLAAGTVLLARTEGRRNELAVCVALGASRARLAAGIVAEGAMVSGLGAAVAVPLSAWLLMGLREYQLPGGVAMNVLRVRPDAGTFAVAVAASLFATMLMAIVAAGVGLSAHVAEALRSHAGVTPPFRRRRTRRALVIADVAVSLVLLSGAGLFARSVAAALALNPGYDTSRLMTASMTMGSTGQGLADLGFDELRARLAHSPAIRSASIETPRGEGNPGDTVVVDGQTRTLTSAGSLVGIDNDYFPTMGLPMAGGRNFTDVDRASGQPVGIVSASFGRIVGAGDSPIGHHVEMFSWFGEKPYQLEIVGVVPDIITNVRELTPMVLYVPSDLVARYPGRLLVIHAAADVAAAAREARAIVAAIDPATPPPTLKTIDERLAEQMGPQRLGAIVMGALGTIAALLTLVGVFVLVQSMAALQRRELGVRAALGATGRQLGAIVLREVAFMTGAGIVGGLVLAWLAAGLIRAFLFRVGPLDVPIFGVVAAGLLVLALAVSARTAVAAGRVDLAQVLREP